MKQLAHRPRDGRVRVQEAPPPLLRPGWLRVRSRFSMLSAGTARLTLALGQENLLGKARAAPALVEALRRGVAVEVG